MKIVFPPIKRPISGKLADVELHFDASEPALDGLKLVGFGIWVRRDTDSLAPDSPLAPSARFPDWTVTFPSRPWKTPQGQRLFAQLRARESQSDTMTRAQTMQPVWRLRDQILEAWQAEQQATLGDTLAP